MFQVPAGGFYSNLYPLPAFVAERLGLFMRVHPSTWRSVVYVGLNARGSFLPLGTGFVAGVPYRDHNFFFFVTADHVVDLVAGDTIYIRMNTKQGVAGPPIPIPKAHKLPAADRRLDLAIFPVPPLHDFYDADYVFLDRAQYNSILEEVWRPSLGDESATIGLYTSHHGHIKNIPVVRVGHIAMLPDEPVMSTRGYVQAYLVETRSIVGLSGSPVCITIPPLRVVDNKIQILDTGMGALCIGMMLGYHLISSKEDEIVVPAMQQAPGSGGQNSDPESNKLSLDERNTGFGVVLPIERLFDVMESEPVRKGMDHAIDHRKDSTRVRPAGVPVVQPPQEAPPSTDANPNHLKDFTRLVDVAARKRPQGGQT
jgi:hypothetical protein